MNDLGDTKRLLEELEAVPDWRWYLGLVRVKNGKVQSSVSFESVAVWVVEVAVILGGIGGFMQGWAAFFK
jgi:hypothetical protein